MDETDEALCMASAVGAEAGAAVAPSVASVVVVGGGAGTGVELLAREVASSVMHVAPVPAGS